MAQAPQQPNDEQEFNSPEEMLARAAYLVFLAALPVGLLLTMAGALSHRLSLGLGGIAAFVVGGLIRGWLRRRGQLGGAARALDGVTTEEASRQEMRLARLVVLLREWDALEQKRGSPGFDPWALQAARNDIQALVENDPALAALFHAERRAA